MDDPGIESRRIGQTLYINLSANPHSWKEQDILRMLEELNSEGTYYLDCDPYYLAVFCQELMKRDLWNSWKKPQVITLSYEFCVLNVKQYLKQLFDVPVFDLYGSTELGYMFIESENGGFETIGPETYFELDKIQDSPNLYSLIVTSDKNPYMPSSSLQKW